MILGAFVTTEFSDFSAVNMGSHSINVFILICTYALVIEQNNAIINKWLDDSCYFPGENFSYSISFSGITVRGHSITTWTRRGGGGQQKGAHGISK